MEGRNDEEEFADSPNTRRVPSCETVPTRLYVNWRRAAAADDLVEALRLVVDPTYGPMLRSASHRAYVRADYLSRPPIPTQALALQSLRSFG